MDTKAKLDICARWLSDKGTAEGNAIPICVKEGNQRFTKAAYDSNNGSFCIVWQDDTPISSAAKTGHLISFGGAIYGKMYRE